MAKIEERGIYVNLPVALDKKLALLARVLPVMASGKAWGKKDVIALACEKFIGTCEEYFKGISDLDEMIEQAKGINIENVQDNDSDMPKADAGLAEF